MSLSEETSAAIDRLLGGLASQVKPVYASYMAGETSLLDYVKQLYKISLDGLCERVSNDQWLGFWDEEILEVVGLKKVGEFSDEDRRWSRFESIVLAPVGYDRFSDAAGPAVEIYYDCGLTEYQEDSFDPDWAQLVVPTKVTSIVWVTPSKKNSEGK